MNDLWIFIVGRSINVSILKEENTECYCDVNGIMQTEETITARRAYSMLNLSIPDVATVNSSAFEGSIESTGVSIESTNVTMINESTQSANISSQIGNIDGALYLYGAPPLILFCIISIVVNIKVLMSVFWIRRPLSPTLYISLSLAGIIIVIAPTHFCKWKSIFKRYCKNNFRRRCFL